MLEINQDKPEISLDDELKNLMLDEITNEILNKKSYRDYLLNTPQSYSKTINFIDTALIRFEQEENYEICTKLKQLMNEILIKEQIV